MDDSGTLVVRLRPEMIQLFTDVVLPAIRARDKWALRLAALLTAMVVVPFIALLTMAPFRPRHLVFLVALTVPGVLAWLAIRQLRHPPTLDQVAFTVTATHVAFGPRANLGLLPIVRPGEQWDRTATRATITPATSLHPARLQLRCATTRTRKHQFGVDQLDQPVETIIAAIERP